MSTMTCENSWSEVVQASLNRQEGEFYFPFIKLADTSYFVFIDFVDQALVQHMQNNFVPRLSIQFHRNTSPMAFNVPMFILRDENNPDMARFTVQRLGYCMFSILGEFLGDQSMMRERQQDGRQYSFPEFLDFLGRLDVLLTKLVVHPERDIFYPIWVRSFAQMDLDSTIEHFLRGWE